MRTETAPEVLAPSVWRDRRRAHEERVGGWTRPHLERRRRGQAHPVEDFLFTYYRFRPAQLRRWSPGSGVLLAGAEGTFDPPLPSAWTTVPAGSDGPGGPVSGGLVLLRPDQQRLATFRWIGELLARTAARPAMLGCFGMHEWAMVYRQPADEVRHGSWPLRLGAGGTAAVVESTAIRCSHFDAFRFFSDPARPLNLLQPTREAQLDLEQPGCLHATMDLYKWAHKLSPWVPAELVADCFALARDVRAIDMRASPYDLSELGYEPVPVETAAGKAQYATAQRSFLARAAPLRARLGDAVARALRTAVDTELSARPGGSAHGLPAHLVRTVSPETAGPGPTGLS